ncbi:MAG: Holliday junction branch migration protein RuvA [Rubricella sp.]
MIGKVSGRIAHHGPDHVMIETAGGVAYVIHCSDRTRASLPAEGEFAALWTELVVREDLWQLYGFQTLAEREWHRLLTSVQGVGAKAALAILGTLGPEGTGRAITLGDAGAIKAAPGIGPKIATRVVNELKDKAPAIMALGGGGAKAASAAAPTVAPAPVAEATPVPAPETGAGADAMAEALSALVNLGYGHGEAATAITEAADAEPGAATPALIRAALRRLAPKG